MAPKQTFRFVSVMSTYTPTAHMLIIWEYDDGFLGIVLKNTYKHHLQ